MGDRKLRDDLLAVLGMRGISRPLVLTVCFTAVSNQYSGD